MAFSRDQLLAKLAAETMPSGLVVAFSGGRDSTVLLHALASLKDRLPAPLRAVHINHQIERRAAQWQQHCRRIAAELGLDCTSQSIDVEPADRRGIEAAARAARYEALKAQLQPGEWLLTAHHADDQLETILLQMLRGSGPAGLAAMPLRVSFGPGDLVRPLLDCRRTDLDDYAEAHGLVFIDDPGNADRDRDRNYLRHAVIPRIKDRWPSVAFTGARVARHAARATDLMNNLADLDLKSLVGSSPSATLPIPPLLALGRPRAENVVRRWLACRSLALPDARRLDTLLTQADEAAPDTAPRVAWAGVEARCWRGGLYAFASLDKPVPLPACWHGESLGLGTGLGELRAVPGKGGLLKDVLAEGVELRWRAGGERLRPAGQAHHRPLKDLLREAAIPPWLRGRVPLLWHKNRLAAVGDLWIAVEFAVPVDKPGVHIRWIGCSFASSLPPAPAISAEADVSPPRGGRE
jgi:tRNA(Ile)-lysidine synthase